MEPRYAHDCERCEFLGQSGKYDLWVCARYRVIDTIIARYGTEGRYQSGLVLGRKGLLKPLTEALERALAAGFIDSRKDL